MADTERREEVQEAIQTVAEAAGEADALEEALERAEEEQEAAEEAAERIAEAAMEAERMRVVEALREEFARWRDDHGQIHATLQMEMAALRTEVANLMERLNTPPQVTVQTVATEPAPSLTPAPSPGAETTVVTVNPSDASGDAPQVPATPSDRPRRARFL